MGKRLESVDVAKGIAIIAIVLGHLKYSSFLFGGADVIKPFVFQFHVPLFFIISGMFLSQKKPLGQFVGQRAARLLGPYVVACAFILFGLLIMRAATGSIEPSVFPRIRDFLLACLYGAGSKSNIVPDGVVPIGAIWFLEALLVAVVEVRLCLQLGKAAPVAVIGLFVIAAWSAGLFWLPLNIQSGLMGGAYVYAGYRAMQARLLERKFSWPLFLALAAVCLVACYCHCDVSIVRAYFGPYCLGLPVSFATSYLVLMVSQLLASHDSPLKRFLVFFGMNSLIVLVVHIVCLDLGFSALLAHVGIPADFNVRFFVNAALQLSLAAACVPLFRRIPLLRRVFF